MANYNDILKQRGIYETAIASGWELHNKRWHYPLFDMLGNRTTNHHRSKLASGNGQKYLWHPSKPKHINFYALPGTISAIQQANGTVYLANGEPSVLAYHTAGIKNVLSLGFGEGNIPQDTVNILEQFGVTHVNYIPDNDKAGTKSAVKLRDKLYGSNITLHVFAWNSHAKGYDANDLWIDCEFNRQTFQNEINRLNALILPETNHTKASVKHRQNIGNLADYDSIKQQVALLLGYSLNDFKADGWARKNISSPFREDRSPSANYNIQSGVLNDFGDRAYRLQELCSFFHIDLPKPTRKQGRAKTIDLATAPKSSRPIPEAVSVDHLTHAKQVNVRYISDLLDDLATQRTWVIKSPLATGKTEAIHHYIAKYQIKRVLMITHSEALCADIAQRLDFTNYQDIPHDLPIHGVDQLVCSLNSLYRLTGAPAYDLVVLDEAEQAIQHLWGGTMRGGDDERAYTTLTEITTQAGQFIALDAHMTDKVANWLQSKRGNLTKIQNQYRPKRDDLCFMGTMGATLEAAIRCTQNNPDACTVLLSSSRKLTRTLHRYFTSQYGEETVISIHGWNSSEARIREILKNPNKAIQKARIFIASPSVGTGIDIQTEVAGVFGFYHHRPLIATQIMQQMMRFRNAQQRALYVPQIEGNLPENALDILLSERGKAKRTAQLAQIPANQIATQTQAEIVELWVQYEADSNQQRNNLFAYVYHLAIQEGFTPILDEHTGEIGKKLLAQIRKEQDALDDQVRCTIPAMSHEELDQKRQNRTIQEIDFIGYERWKIEDTVGLEITPELNERYKKARARSGLVRFTNYMLATEVSQEIDHTELRLLPHERHNHTATRHLFESAIEAAFGKAGLTSTEQIHRQELETRLSDFINHNLKDIHHFVDKRNDLSEEVIPIFRRILASHGIKLCSRQIMHNGKRFMVYWLDQDNLEILKTHARARIRHLNTKEHATKNAEISTFSYVNLVVNPSADYYSETQNSINELQRLFTGDEANNKLPD